MLMQYLDYKRRYPDCLLFFQVGDFYELFFQDAVTVSTVINLTLTSRDKNSENPVPMCGVPISVGEQYCDRLVQLGYSVAIVSQSEPASGKGMVARKLERIITPAVKILAGADAAESAGLVGALSIVSNNEVAIAYTDVQSGMILYRDGFSVSEIPTVCMQVSIVELIVPALIQGKTVDRRTGWIRGCEVSIDQKNIKFRSADTSLQAACTTLQNFTTLNPSTKGAVILLMSYLNEVTIENDIPIHSIVPAQESERVFIDATTRLNLELIKNARDGSERGTLLEYLNHTKTIGGYRGLRQELIAPLKNLKTIEDRLQAVSECLTHEEIIDSVHGLLAGSPDIERIAARIELGVVTPRELGALRDICEKVPTLSTVVKGISALAISESVTNTASRIFNHLQSSIVEEPPLSMFEGGIFQASYNAELARLQTLETSGTDWVSAFEQQERAATGINTLKVKFNSVFGYFIDISNAQLSKVPDRYTRKQTTANSERFITPELKTYEHDILKAHDQRVVLEKNLFNELRESLKTEVTATRDLYHSISRIDLIVAIAKAAQVNRLTRPQISGAPELNIVGGKHPQISAAMGAQFIENDITISSDKVSTLLITGPNMGGKSTYLRQTALIAVMAQIGSFVPAVSATIGVTDKIFARLGASDNIAEGESTFMVEMREASAIIQNATAQSLVLIDEIGRGTSTRDGLAIAQSILEWLVVKTKARVLFATHFHELTELEPQFKPSLKNISVGSTEIDGQLIFTHRLVSGAATKSFGIEVAKRAGIPEPVTARAKVLLDSIEVTPAKRVKAANSPLKNQLELFNDPAPSDPQAKEDKISIQKYKTIAEVFGGIDINLLTPLEALNVLAKIKASMLILLIILGSGLFFSTSLNAEPLSAKYEAVKKEYFQLRNTDSHVSNPARWVLIGKKLVDTAAQLSSNEAAPCLLNAASLYRTMAVSGIDDASEYQAKANDLYEQILADYPTSSAAPESLKALYEIHAVSDSEKAKSFLRRIIQEYPASDYVDFAKLTLRGGSKSEHSASSGPSISAALQKTIVLDPGHGGEDLGAVGIGGLLEKDVTLDIAERVKKKLSNDPRFNVVLTRTDDVFMPLQKRTEFANANDADIFVSIHCNSSEKANLKGFEIYTLDNSKDSSAKRLADRENAVSGAGNSSPEASDLSMMLGDLIQSSKLPESMSLAALIQGAVKQQFVTNSHGDDEPLQVLKEKKAPFYVLVGAHMPAVLVETAFINQSDDGLKLLDPKFREGMANAVAAGINKFFAVSH